MKITWRALLILFSIFFNQLHSFGQCPNYSPVNYFDTSCFVRLPSELKVGQGHLGLAELWGTTGARSFDFYIPQGREGWAIAVVHAWLTQRNTLKYPVDAFNWHYYYGTMFKESFGACDPNLSFTGINRCNNTSLVNPFTSLDNYTLHTGAGDAARVDGCLQIDHSSGWPVMTTYYPWRWNNYNQFLNYISEDHFETACLAKMQYDLVYIRMMEYVKGYPVEDVFTTTNDWLGPTKLIAMSYNKGFGGTPENIFNAANIPALKASSDWLTLAFDAPDLNYDYTIATSHVTKVLSNNLEGGWTRPWSGTGWTNTSDNQWHCWYDKPISWSIMTTYMNKFFPLYPEVNSATVTAKVKAVFDAINGGNPISFRYKFAPVIEEFVLNMPYDDPMQELMYSTAGNSGCKKSSNCIGVAPTLKPKGSTTFCQGLSVDLETVAGNGFTYQWYKDGALVTNSNALPNVFTAKLSGVYSVKITNSSGCTTESDCQITVNAIACSSCSMTANATSTNNTCTGSADGSVSVTLTNGSFPVTYLWTGPTSGNTATLSNVMDGTYTVTVTKQSDPTCIAYATTTVNTNKVLNQKLQLTGSATTCSNINLEAKIIDNPPASCDYHLKVVYNNSGNCYGFWDKSTLNVLAFADNVNMNVSTPRANGSGNCTHLDEIITIPHNKSLSIVVKNLNGTTQTGADFSVQLVNSQGTTVLNYNLNGKSFPTGSTTVFTGTGDCSSPVPTYTMTWSPTTELTAITYTTNDAKATAVLTADRTYTMTAQHPTFPTCKMASSIFADYTCPGNLPVDLIYLEVTSEYEDVNITWVTANERDADKFQIESSRDGANFLPIGVVRAVGNSTTPQIYHFVDGITPEGMTYYRIKEIDLNGDYKYSEVKMITHSQNHVFKVFPNPSTDAFHIQFAEKEDGEKINLQLMDVTERLIFSKDIVVSGESSYLLNDPLPKGVYILKILDTSSESIFKLIKE